MPLKKGKSKKVQSRNIAEMIASPTFARGKSPAKRRQMAVAAAKRTAGVARRRRGPTRSK